MGWIDASEFVAEEDLQNNFEGVGGSLMERFLLVQRRTHATQVRNASQLMKSEDDTILIFIDCECCSFYKRSVMQSKFQHQKNNV
jgi:hypothetical protein